MLTSILAVLLVTGTSFFEAFVAKSYWDWFMPSEWYAPTLVQWFALNMIVSVFARHAKQTKDTREPMEQAKDAGIFLFVAPAVMLVVGFIVHRLI